MENVIQIAKIALSAGFSRSEPPQCVAFWFDPHEVSGWKRCKELLRSSREFTIKRKRRVNDKEGCSVEGIARWGNPLAFEEGGHRFRYHILLLRCRETGFGFAIRAVGKSAITTLPGIDLTQAEVELALKFADKVSERGKEILVKLPTDACIRTIAMRASEL